MSVDNTNNNVGLIWIYNFDTDSRDLEKYMQELRSDLGLKAREFEMYKRTPPAEDSVGVEVLE